jgi:hypothetical protein
MESCKYSVNQERERMKEELSVIEFKLDTLRTDISILRKMGIDSLEIKLNKNGKYFLTPSYQALAGYDGEWDLSDDSEISYFIFKSRSGEYQKNRSLSLKVKLKDITIFIHFCKK